jgi:hypothetical membrane protein
MEVRQAGGATPGLEGQRSLIAALAAAGIVAPLIFTAAALVQSLLRADHSLVAHPISALGARPSGWVQDANFVLCGALLVAYAIGLHLGVHPARLGVLGPALLVLGGVGVVLAGVFPAVDASRAFSEEQVRHTVASYMAFLGTGIGFIVLSRRLVRDPRWRSLASYALASGIAIVVLILAFGPLAEESGTPLHSWMGLFEWVIVAVWFACTIVLSLRLRRVARAVDVRP